MGNVGLDAVGVGGMNMEIARIHEKSATKKLKKGNNREGQVGENLLDKELLSSSDITRQIYQVVL